MRERDIQRWLHFDRRSAYAMMLPNYTPLGWFEADLFGVSKSGYFHEFEIKLSRSDFMADANKRSTAIVQTPGGWEPAPEKTKHERLAARDRQGPSRFAFVVPKQLADQINVPEFAGLIAVEGESGEKFARVRIVKPSPQLHDQKIDRRIIRHARSVCYYRYWTELTRAERN